MRTAEINDYWNRLETKKSEFKTQLKKLDTNNLGIVSSNQINFEGQLIAICGKNGVGKSTLLSSIIALLNPQYFKSSALRQKKLSDSTFTLDISHLGKDYSIVFPDVESEEEDVRNSLSSEIIDTANDCIEFLNIFSKQVNLSDLIEPAPKRDLKEKELKELGFILNKEISKCYIYDIELTEEIHVPYFEIEYSGRIYGTELLGLGEIAVIYIYSVLKNLSKDSCLIIEEPETYLSYQTQENLINIIAKYTVEKKLCTIITSHSHAVINKIPSNNMIYISRIGNMSIAKKPTNKYRTLKSLGMPLTIPLVFCVEDNVARSIVTNIFDRYQINSIYDYLVVPVGGVEKIIHTLNFPDLNVLQSKIVGIFDGDQRIKIQKRFDRPYTFLPGDTSPEKQFKSAISSNLESMSSKLGLDVEKLGEVMTVLEGIDEHDWFIEFCKSFSIQEDRFIDKMITILFENDEAIFNNFIAEIHHICKA